ncbi:MAG: pantetheine-phosphate adenylyltransferase [Elusimicrobia bacterium CG1_02_37_114]|nr:MAG: pantetheine-phosphate adenylyltransferase [Elusimicrobia bacterium CG1_02_37_114]
MKRVAVYPGSFDPPTNGHIDIIKRACDLFDKVIIAIIDNPAKKPAFTIEEREYMLEKSIQGLSGVDVEHFSGLLVKYLRKKKARIIIRGLREMSDFEYEFQMALMNRKLDNEIETVFLMPDERWTYLSSSVIKEVAGLGGNVKCLVPPVVEKMLRRLSK